MQSNTTVLFVYVDVSLAGDQPSLELLWLGSGPDVSALRLACFLSVFDCQDFSELFGAVDDCLLAALCLVTHIALQVLLSLLSIKFM